MLPQCTHLEITELQNCSSCGCLRDLKFKAPYSTEFSTTCIQLPQFTCSSTYPKCLSIPAIKQIRNSSNNSLFQSTFSILFWMKWIGYLYWVLHIIWSRPISISNFILEPTCNNKQFIILFLFEFKFYLFDALRLCYLYSPWLHGCTPSLFLMGLENKGMLSKFLYMPCNTLSSSYVLFKSISSSLPYFPLSSISLSMLCP